MHIFNAVQNEDAYIGRHCVHCNYRRFTNYLLYLHTHGK